jgi:hypothetical protein
MLLAHSLPSHSQSDTNLPYICFVLGQRGLTSLSTAQHAVSVREHQPQWDHIPGADSPHSSQQEQPDMQGGSSGPTAAEGSQG